MGLRAWIPKNSPTYAGRPSPQGSPPPGLPFPRPIFTRVFRRTPGPHTPLSRSRSGGYLRRSSGGNAKTFSWFRPILTPPCGPADRD